MLSKSNVSITDTLKLFRNLHSDYILDTAFLVPTETGMMKSILDATMIVREFLKKHSIHDYESQKQGPENRVQIETLIISKDIYTQTTTSLYRPVTKSGDPRIWIYDLKKHADPNDLLALLISTKGLVVVNCSKTNLKELLNSENKLFWDHFDKDESNLSFEAEELLEKLRTISRQGYIKTLKKGDTGVGYTLETLLGIQANSSKRPDYKGVELKAARNRGRRGDRTTIFSKVPDWESSRLKSSKEILRARGYFSAEKNRHQLFHTLSCSKKNSLGLILNIEKEKLYQKYVNLEGDMETDVVWKLSVLNSAFLEKHNQTLWVYADTSGKGHSEEFFYSQAKYTRGPDESRLALLLETGDITVDYSIQETATGGAKDQGYLFKIAQENIELLFDNPKNISLL